MEELLASLLLPPAAAREAWESWRAAIEIDDLPYHAQQLLPALNAKLGQWIAGDPAAGIFQGIVRKVWTLNQLRLRKACEVAARVEQAGASRPIFIGPAAWAMATRAPAIRSVPYLSLLIPRSDVATVTDTLIQTGWRPHAEPPPEAGDAMDWSDHISFSQDDLQLYLHWRLISVSPEDAYACEQAFLQRLVTIDWNRQNLLTLAPETNLLHILAGDRRADVLPWQADITLTRTSRIYWPRLRKLAARFCPQAFDRLQIMRSFGFPIPEFAPPNPSAVERRFRNYWSLYRVRNYQIRQPVNAVGFLQFLAARWNLSSVWHIPAFVAVHVARQLRTRVQ